jgi:hypothetical protein
LLLAILDPGLPIAAACWFGFDIAFFGRSGSRPSRTQKVLF